MNLSLSDKRIESAIQLTNSIFPLIILPLATIGNILCFLVFCRPKFQKRLTRTSSICLRLLCINDLVLLYLFIIDVLLKIYMKPSVRIYTTPTTCRLYKFIRYSFLDMSAYIQLGLTTDRFICCVYHTYYSHWRKRNYLYYLLLIAFILIISKNSSFLSPLYGYTILSKNRTSTKCAVKIEAKYFTIYMAYGQSLIDVVFITCIPFFLIVYFNSRILREVLQIHTQCWSTISRLIHLTPGETKESIRRSPGVLTCHRAKRRRLHLTFALGCISFVFVLSTAPYKIFKVVERHDKVVRDQQKNGSSKSTNIQLAEVIIDCLEYLSCSTPFFVCLTTSSGSNGRLELRQNAPCSRQVLFNRIIIFTCYEDQIMENLNFDGLEEFTLDTADGLRVTGQDVRGPLTSIPNNICRLKNLKHLHLVNNRITSTVFNVSSSCLSGLVELNLSNNFISEISDQWIYRMSNLKLIDLSQNHLTSIPITMFSNISNIEILHVTSNKLTTFELGLIQIKSLIDFSKNPITRFSNDYKVDLSNYRSNITRQIALGDGITKIDFNDGIFEMYNRCGEINATYTQLLMETITRIHEYNYGLFNWNCSCDYYHLQEYIVTNRYQDDFSTWKCPGEDTIIYKEKCHNQTSFNFMSVTPRFCKINNREVCLNLDFFSNYSTLESITTEMYNQLIMINVSNAYMTSTFVKRIDQFNNKLNNLTTSEKVTDSIRTDLQNITSKIESLLESINIPLNITLNSISILSLYKNSAIDSYSQINGGNSSLYYSTETNNENSIASIIIDKISIGNLSERDIYTFYYLPSSLFQHAQKDQNKIIVSPVVGVHLPNRCLGLVNMSFTHDERPFGRYSCEFWQLNDWNDTGCYHSKGSKSNHHICICNHTTSFALIFIPDRPIPETYIPSITIAILSIVCFFISIILSIHRQAISFRHLSIANIFTLINSIILFILLTVILIRGYQSSHIRPTTNDICPRSEQNLVIATYFFLILTFASKTLLGICYFLTIFFHYVFIQFTSVSSRWLYGSMFFVILIAIIPTTVIRVIVNQQPDLFLQYAGICWFNTSVIFRVVSIPILIFIGLNLLVISVITIRLFQFILGRKMAQTSERRIIISVMIWLSLCISLGVAWIFGPFLSVITTEKNRSSVILQWIFGFFIGFEGLWVLIINVVFYSNQKINMKNRQMTQNKANKYER